MAVGNLETRLLAYSANQEGVEVSGFVHGEPIIYQWDKYSWLEYPIVDRFYYYSSEAAIEAHNILEHYPSAFGTAPKLLGADI